MKRTLDDASFAAAFGRELKRHYDDATKPGTGGPELSDEQFAATLDVTRPALRKYLNGSAMPALRVVVLAFQRYKINVPYFGTPLFGKSTKAGVIGSAMTQLVLPFSVQGLNTETIEAKIEAKGENRFELRVNVRRVG
jgi:transcriptional regulator with XRE-family HTH domain